MVELLKYLLNTYFCFENKDKPREYRKVWVHSGYVKSKDGDSHFISAKRVAELYNLYPGTYKVWPEGVKAKGLKPSGDDLHLYPRSDGNYEQIHRMPI